MAWLPASSRTVAPARSAIIRWGDQTIGGIAVRLDLEPSTITPLVKRLEQAGHVLRQRLERIAFPDLDEVGQPTRFDVGAGPCDL